VFPVRYELGFYIPEDGILHSHRRENFKYYKIRSVPKEVTDRVQSSGIPGRTVASRLRMES
jgi:hypothetical protein